MISPANTVGLLDYSLDSLSFQPVTSFSGLSAGTYTLITRDDRNCLRTQAVQIPLNCPSLMTIPTAFSPNADHINDALTVYFRFPSITISQFTVSIAGVQSCIIVLILRFQMANRSGMVNWMDRRYRRVCTPTGLTVCFRLEFK